MKNFKFKYQNIEDIKERIKKNTEREYSQILLLIEDKKNEIIKIENLVEESFNLKQKLSPKELVFLNHYRETLNNKIKRKTNELNELENKRKKKLSELTARHKEHKIFEKLKEKMHSEFKYEAGKIEQKNNDDIANQKYSREEK